jgi:hypothetical protein
VRPNGTVSGDLEERRSAPEILAAASVFAASNLARDIRYRQPRILLEARA